jgi:glycogen synthase
MVDDGRKSWQVLMTTDAVGGIWNYSLELASGLAEFGVRTILACMGPPPGSEQRAAAAAIPGLSLQESDYRLEWMPDADLDVARAGRWLLELEKRFAPDLIHLNGYAHAVLNWQAPCMVVAHSCVLSWWQAVRGESAPPEWRRYADRAAAGLRAAAVVVAPTEAFQQTLVANYGTASKAKIIWNGRCPARFVTAAKEELIFGAGRLWDEAKNIAALQKAASHLSWPVVVAGRWHRPEGGGRQPAGIRCLGPLAAPEMVSWLRRAAIYALPARYEPFGLSILEAALAGCALVLGDIPTLRELWRGAALFVPPDDHRQLRLVLQELTVDGRLRDNWGQAARARACLYNSERMTMAYLELYGELLAGHFTSGTLTARS